MGFKGRQERTRALAVAALIALVVGGIGFARIGGSVDPARPGTGPGSPVAVTVPGPTDVELETSLRGTIGRSDAAQGEAFRRVAIGVDTASLDTSQRHTAPAGDVGLADQTSTPEGAHETYAVFRTTHTPNPVPLLPGSDNLTDAVLGAKAEIFRHDDRIEFTLETTELEEHAYTVWLAVYNIPELCRDPDTDGGRHFRCGSGDMLNFAAGFSLMWGSGEEVTADESSFHAFHGQRHRFDLDGVLIGPGLIDPRGAEIHLILRDHGPCPSEGCGERLNRVDGDCSNPHFGGLLWPRMGKPGDYECSNLQATGY